MWWPEAATLEDADASVVHGTRPEDDTTEVITSRERLVEVCARRAPRSSRSRAGPRARFGSGARRAAISASELADLAARGIAELRPVIHPGDSPAESHYRPSSKLADFVRCRDLTCRFPGCDAPADICDVDHTIPTTSAVPRMPRTSNRYAETSLAQDFLVRPRWLARRAVSRRHGAVDLAVRTHLSHRAGQRAARSRALRTDRNVERGSPPTALAPPRDDATCRRRPRQ